MANIRKIHIGAKGTEDYRAAVGDSKSMRSPLPTILWLGKILLASPASLILLKFFYQCPSYFVKYLFHLLRSLSHFLCFVIPIHRSSENFRRPLNEIPYYSISVLLFIASFAPYIVRFAISIENLVAL